MGDYWDSFDCEIQCEEFYRDYPDIDDDCGEPNREPI